MTAAPPSTTAHLASPGAGTVWGEACRFLRGHLGHVLALIPGAVLVTLLHESAHALAVWLQGGEVTEFVWFPSGRAWGHIRFRFAPGAAYSSTLISLAPHLLWGIVLAAAAALAVRSTSPSDRRGAAIYFWMVFVPLMDVGYAAAQWAAGYDNDLAKAWGPPGSWTPLLLVSAGALAWIGGFWLQRRLYARWTLGWRAYSALFSLAVMSLVALTVVAWPPG